MARKLKKFSEGGSDKYKARYDRKVADIKSDYEKAQARKTGRAAEVAKAKYEQRLADADDDLAKWTKSDRTATRASEKAAEKNLSMTRKFGARSSENLVAKAENKLAEKVPLSSVDTTGGKSKPSSFKEAFAAARKNPEAMKAGKFTWNGKSYSTAIAGEKKAPPKRTGAGKAPAGKPGAGKPDTPAKVTPPANAGRGAPTPASANVGRSNPPTTRNIDRFNLSRVREEMNKSPQRSPLFAGEDKLKAAQARAAAAQRGYAKGGNVKKYNKGSAVSPLGTQKEIVDRANRTPHEKMPKTGPVPPKRKPLKPAGMKGYAKGGSVDGIAKKGKTRCKGMK